MDALAVQLVAQHARSHEGMFQMQLVDPAHERKVGRTDRLGQVVDRPPRLILSRLACAVMESLLSRSIMALRSAIPLW